MDHSVVDFIGSKLYILMWKLVLCGFSFLKEPQVLVFTFTTQYIGSQSYMYVDRWEKKATTKVDKLCIFNWVLI
jgi:hypothetical protein